MRKLVAFTLLLAAACVSISTVQTASVVPDGKLRAAIAPQVGVFTPPSSGGAPSSTAVLVPNVEVAARYGLGSGTDIGIKAGSLGYEADVKHELIDNGSVVLSVAPGVGAAHLGTGSAAGGGSGTVTVLNGFLPLLLGVKVAGGSELVIGPKLIFEYAINGRGDTNTATLFGGVIGYAVRASPSFLVMPEVNFATVVQQSNNQPTGGVAVQAGVSFLFDR